MQVFTRKFPLVSSSASMSALLLGAAAIASSVAVAKANDETVPLLPPNEGLAEHHITENGIGVGRQELPLPVEVYDNTQRLIASSDNDPMALGQGTNNAGAEEPSVIDQVLQLVGAGDDLRGTDASQADEQLSETTEPVELEPSLTDQLLNMIGLGQSDTDEEVVSDGAVTSEDEAAEEVIRAVELIRPGAEKTVLQRNFFGRVVARETADLAFPLNGTLQQFPVDEGAIIEEGSVIAQLDLATFERAVERAEITLEQAERTLARTTELANRRVGPRTAAEDALTARNLAEVALREARDALDDATITAPYRALVAERLTANYVIVEPGMPVVRVHDISQMRVELDIPERLVQRFPVTSDVEFLARLSTFEDPVRLELVEFQAQTQAVGQSYTFTLALPDMTSTVLLPGSSVTVTAALPTPEPSLVLPPTAIAADAQRQPYVMVFEPAGADEGKVRAVAVEVSSVDGTSFTVSGLPSDVEIVETGAHLLRDGQNVRRFTSLRVEE